MVRKSGGLAGSRLRRLSLLALVAGALATSLIDTAAGTEDRRGLVLEEAVGGQPAAGTSIGGGDDAPSNRRDTTFLPLRLSAIHVDGTGAGSPRQFSSSLAELRPEASTSVIRLVAVPDCDAVSVAELGLSRADEAARLVGPAAAALVSVDRVVHIRDQAVAVVRFDLEAIRRGRPQESPWTDITVELTTDGGRGPASTNTGPFTHACGRTLANYDAAPAWTPPAGREGRTGSVRYCDSVADCVDEGTDILLIAAETLANSGALLGFAVHDAIYLGLNVGIVDVGALPELTAEAIHDFIRELYITQSAEHFGDGHLGFVVLVGDAYADDNETVMIPTYDGYGGTEVASDHYYACVSGDDDLEDVMTGRLSVGSPSELSAVVNKVVGYAPHDPGENWYDRVLLVAGLFYTVKEDYVALFDEYEELIPDDVAVDRIYRHDFASNGQCAHAVVDAINDGYLFVDYAGDGWKFNWHLTMGTEHIPLMANADRLPIVFSMACMTGWFDNTTDADAAGSYDCLAEQLVNTPARGAVACLAASRSSDGGIFRTISKKLYQAAFAENCVFLGETIAVAKLLHIQDGDDVDYTRHFNLFGDPTLIFGSATPPFGEPDLVVRSHDVGWSPEFPQAGDNITVTVPVRNQSQEPVGDVTVRVSRIDAGGSYDVDGVIPYLDAWSVQTVEITVPMPSVGSCTLDVSVDPDDQVAELHEDNNSFSRPSYAYPHLPGFPIDLGSRTHGPCTAHLSGDGKHVLVCDDEARLLAFAGNGELAWQTAPGTAPLTFGREIAPAVGDLNGDGDGEVVFTKRMAVAAASADGEELWTVPTQDPLGYPILADVDGDGDLDAVVATVGTFGSPCKIVAFDEDGQQIWAHSVLPTSDDVTACPVAGDFDLDGRPDVAYGTSDGTVAALSCAQSPPVQLWGPLDLGGAEIAALALGDIDGDEALELVAADDAIICLNAEDGSDLGWNLPIGPGVVTLALGDVDGDGVADIVAGTASGDLCLIADGTVVWTVPLSGTPSASASIADIDGDDHSEILVGTTAGYLHILTDEGEDFLPPMPIPGGSSTPFVGNLTGEDDKEVLVSSGDGVLFAFEFEADGSSSVPEWAGLGRSATRGGVHIQPLGGALEGNTLLAGCYRVTDDLSVGTGAALTIASDTVLEFDSDPPTHLEVDGVLEAQGSPGSEIVFAGWPAGPRSTWGGMSLGPSATATLSSCRVSGAATAIDANQCSVAVIDCEFTENGTALRAHGCTLDARNSAFSRSDSVGISIDGGAGSIVACSFEANGAAGIECEEAGAYEIRESTFTGSPHGDGARLSRHSDVTIDSCTFTENAEHGMTVKTSTPTVKRSSFSGNGLYGVYCARLGNPDISWCTVADNKIGVVTEAGSSPNLGNDMYPDSGYNSITGNRTAAIANCASANEPVYARRNWWGTPVPMGRIFDGYVAYAPWLTEPPDSTMSEVREDDVPSDFGLFQNAPNPFNPTTTITYQTPVDAGRVEIAVYDAAGRRVATLCSGRSVPGTHRIVWAGLDDRGNRVASGTYFVRMSAAGYTATRKVTLLK
jgi:hypothetical protein